MAPCRMLVAAVMLVLAAAAGRPGYAALSGALSEEPQSLPDPELGVALIRDAASQNDPLGLVILADLYAIGVGVDKAEKRIRAWTPARYPIRQ